MSKSPDKHGQNTEPDDDEHEQTEEETHLDELLDEALEDTFPASDPVSITPPDDHSEA